MVADNQYIPPSKYYIVSLELSFFSALKCFIAEMETWLQIRDLWTTQFL